MKNAVLYLLLFLATCPAFAGSVITKSYHQRPLPEVLRDIDKAAPDLDIHFIYNKLEDYTVTTSIRNATPLEAIRQAIGFYPVSVKQEENTIIVEPVFDTEQKLIGRIVDEKGHPLEFANVRLFSPSDNSLITGGVTNKNGDFVIPCSPGRFTVNVSYVGYETLVRSIEMPASGKTRNVGTWAMKPGKETLSTVVVEGDLATTSAEKSTYIPTRRQRNAATDATALLAHMMIPQLRVNPASGYVTTLSGESVTIFIDYLPATAQDLEGMNTQDVKRVEIYDFPKDVRFQNKPHVVNFVMQKYEIGGYTKLTSTEAVLADFTANNSVYSKLAHKNWTFDANASNRYIEQNHMGSISEETYNLTTQTINRTQLSENGHLRRSNWSASLRATYNSEKMQLANRIEFLHANNPKSEMPGSVTYSPAVLNSTKSISRQDSREITPTYRGDWNFFLPRDWSLSVSPSFQFSRNKQNRFFQENNTIENRIDESASRLEWKIGLNKKLGKKHTVGFVNWGLIYHSDLDYIGSTTSSSKVNQFCNAAGLSYQFSTQKLSLNAEYLYTFNKDKVNGQEISNPYSIANIYARFSPSSHHAISAELAFNSGTPSGAQRNPNVMQENPLLFYCGNPALGNFEMLKAQLQYTWLPSNTFSASAFARHYYYHNNYTNIYEPYNDGTAIIRRIDHTGKVNETYVGARFSLRLLDGNLQLAAAPRLVHFHTSGLYKENSTQIDLDMSAIYYLKQFNFVAGYSSPQKFYWRNSATWMQYRSDYFLAAGWGNAAWKAKLEIINPFRTDWRGNKSIITTPFFSQTQTALNNSNHQRLNLTLTYIFNYGKKVKQGNELGTASGGQSSIL